MNNETYKLNDAEYVRVTKSTARKLHANGQSVYVIACNLNPYSERVQFGEIVPTENFDTGCSAYQYYNCNAETGKYVKYFQKQ